MSADYHANLVEKEPDEGGREGVAGQLAPVIQRRFEVLFVVPFQIAERRV